MTTTQRWSKPIQAFPLKRRKLVERVDIRNQEDTPRAPRKQTSAKYLNKITRTFSGAGSTG